MTKQKETKWSRDVIHKAISCWVLGHVPRILRIKKSEARNVYTHSSYPRVCVLNVFIEHRERTKHTSPYDKKLPSTSKAKV